MIVAAPVVSNRQRGLVSERGLIRSGWLNLWTMARRLAAIMFTDLVGYTSLSQSDEQGALQLVQEQERLLRSILATHHGRKVKSTGDGLLLEFQNALEAVECGVELQRRVHEHTGLNEDPSFRIRVGIHLGDVQRRGADILGDSVNIAARIEPLAEPGGICLSEAVHAQVRNKVPYQMEALGPKLVKGVREPIQVYRIVLPWISAPAPEAPPASQRIAVLPLANISADPADEYFAAGLTEELISALSQIRGLRVIAHTSVNQYKSTTKTVSQIGSELGAGTILEGSVRRSERRIRVALQLIDAKSQEHLWATTYDRELSDVFHIQTEVAERTAEALRLKLLTPPEEVERARPTKDLTAYDYYLKAVYFGTRDGIENRNESFRWYEKATQRDPAFALAFAQWGCAVVREGGWSLPGKEAYPKARELIERARELSPDLPEVHGSLGVLALKGNLDWATAEAELRQAISLQPSYAAAHFWLAVVLFTTGRFDPAIEEFRTTIQLDPENTDAWDWLAQTYLQNADPQSAVATAELQRDRDPTSAMNHGRLGMIYWMIGRREEAEKEFAATSELTKLPPNSFGRWAHATGAALFGQREEAQSCLSAIEEVPGTGYVSSWMRGLLYASLGQKEQALTLLEKDEREGDRLLWWYFWVPNLDFVRDDPRFQALLREAKLPLTVYHPSGAAPRTPV